MSDLLDEISTQDNNENEEDIQDETKDDVDQEDIPEGVIYTGEILTTAVNIRTSPGSGSPKVTTNPKYLVQGDKFYVYEMSGDWAKFIHPTTNTYVWVYTGKKYAKLTPVNQVTVKDSTEIDTENNIITEAGEEPELQEENKEDLDELTPKYKGVVVANSIHIRTGPGMGYQTFASLGIKPSYLLKGDRIDIYEIDDNGWAKIIHPTTGEFVWVATKRMVGSTPATYIEYDLYEQPEVEPSETELPEENPEETAKSDNEPPGPEEQNESTSSQSPIIGETGHEEGHKWYEYYPLEMYVGKNGEGSAGEADSEQAAVDLENMVNLSFFKSAIANNEMSTIADMLVQTPVNQRYNRLESTGILSQAPTINFRDSITGDSSNDLLREWKKALSTNSPDTVQNDQQFPVVISEPDGINGGYQYDYAQNYSEQIENFDAMMKSLRLSLNIPTTTSYYDTFLKNATYYNRFKYPTWNDQLERSFGHIFFIKPDINLFGDNTIEGAIDVASTAAGAYVGDGTIKAIHNNNRQLLRQLTHEDDENHHFALYLSNKARTLDIPDEELKTSTYGQTATGFAASYAKHNLESKQNNKINIDFIDDRNLSIYKLHKVWVEYMAGCFRGIFRPKKEYINSHSLDYATALYYVLTAEDGETIIFWSKFYGVFPLNVPSSTYSKADGELIGKPQVKITYQYSIKEDLNPVSLLELNMHSSAVNSYTNMKDFYVPSYDPTNMVASTWVGVPFVEEVVDESGTSNQHSVFKLRFRPAKYF